MEAFALAFFAGILSFSSPCCLPLMPGYVAYVSGVTGSSTTATASRIRAVGAAALFVLGFTVVFTLLGAAASTLGSAVLAHRTGLTQLSGLVVVALGLVTMGALRVPLLSREFRIDLRRVSPGPAGALPLGMAFAVGWTPCIGPVLAAILTAAASTEAPLRGAALLFTYSLGLGVPFMLLAAGTARSGSLSGWLRRHGGAVERVGGALLIAMGVLMITGAWQRMLAPIVRTFTDSGWPPL